MRLQSPSAQESRHSDGLSAAPVATDAYTMNNIMSGIDKKLLTLKLLFRKSDPLEDRAQAAVRIQAAIRGYLVRQKMRLFRQNRRSWRWIRCRPVVLLLDMLLSLHSKVFLKIQMLKLNRNISQSPL